MNVLYHYLSLKPSSGPSRRAELQRYNFPIARHSREMHSDCQLPKLDVAGSSPVCRSIYFQKDSHCGWS